MSFGNLLAIDDTVYTVIRLESLESDGCNGHITLQQRRQVRLNRRSVSGPGQVTAHGSRAHAFLLCARRWSANY